MVVCTTSASFSNGNAKQLGCWVKVGRYSPARLLSAQQLAVLTSPSFGAKAYHSCHALQALGAALRWRGCCSHRAVLRSAPKVLVLRYTF